MSTSTGVALRPMGLLEIVDQTFRLYRRNLWLFLGIAAVVYVPLGVLEGIPVVGELAPIIFAPLFLVAGAALTKAVSDRYLGESTSVGAAYRHVGRRFWPLAFTTIVTYLFVVSGVLLLVVGVFVFAFWAAFVPQVFVIENRRYFDAIWRSRFLVGKGTWAEFLVLMIIVGVLTGIIQLVAGTIIGVSMFPETAEALPMHAAVILGIVNAFVLPIGQVAAVLLYYDSRIRKEGFDLQMLAREMGTPTAMPAPPTTGPEAPSGGGPQTG